MTNEKDSRLKGLRDEAADWFAIMRGPEAVARRREFDAWLARDALHRSAYNRIAETFSIGKGLKPSAEDQDVPPSRKETAPSATARRRRIFGVGVAVALVAGAAVVTPRLLVSDLDDHRIAQVESSKLASAPAQFATRIGEIRAFSLTDGSSVTLDSDSLMVVSISSARRDLQLIRGRARFTVAHDMRPFVVAVAGGTVTARGTVFDITLDRSDRVVVRLLRGSVDVRMPTAAGTAAPAQTKRMAAGETISFGNAPSPSVQEAPGKSNDWPEGVLDLGRVRLAEVIADANRYTTKPLVLATPDLAELRLSGTFRVRDTRRLAENVGDLLGLAVIDRGDAFLLARSCPANQRANCRSPS